ncbi:unnamed protein product [Lampetra fluviatilis]
MTSAPAGAAASEGAWSACGGAAAHAARLIRRRLLPAACVAEPPPPPPIAFATGSTEARVAPAARTKSTGRCSAASLDKSTAAAAEGEVGGDDGETKE